MLKHTRLQEALTTAAFAGMSLFATGACRSPAFAEPPAAMASPAAGASPAAAASPPGGDAGQASPAAADIGRSRLAALLRGHADPAWFSATFLAHVTVNQVDDVVMRVEATLGDYQSVDGSVGDYTARFAKGMDEVLVHLDPDGKINLLIFRPYRLQASPPPN